MNASDVMSSYVVTTTSGACVQDVAKIMIENRISAVPVVDEQGVLIGIISEGDLMRRAEAGTERRRPWWLRMLVGSEALAFEYVKEHSRKISDLMTRDVVAAAPGTPLHEIAALLEKHAIKRVPIVEKGKLIGIVSCANLLRALASAGKQIEGVGTVDDTALRQKIETQLKSKPWGRTWLVNVIVQNGTVDLWGMVNTQAEKKAIRVAAEVTPGVRAVNDNLIVRPVISAA